MKRIKEICTVYSAGLVQGIALVAFPAAASVLTDPNQFALSSADYGKLFIPQSIIAIIASFYCAKLIKKWGAKQIFLHGLLANLISMSLLAASAFYMHDKIFTYTLLLAATGFLGLGFGLTVPTANLMAPLFNPKKIDEMILILNALLGVGTALAPLLAALFIGLGCWWGLPMTLVLLLLILLGFSFTLSLPGGAIETTGSLAKELRIPREFWLFALFALLYGIIETLNGNWIVLYMKNYEGASMAVQSLSLAAFWSMVTLGRLFFAIMDKALPQTKTFQGLPFLLIAGFGLIFWMPKDHSALALVVFGLLGFACSALLPLAISFGQTQLKTASTFAAGGIIAFYLAGYGIAAFGAGGLLELSNLSLNEIYGLGAITAIPLALAARKIAAKERNIR